MENQVQIFKNPQFGEIRTAGTSEEPLFCLADLCKAVGIANSRNVRNRLDNDDVHLMDIVDSIGKRQKITFVTESGFYDVILRSDSPQAKPFRKWVTSEVLPSIRKTGKYVAEHTGSRHYRTRGERMNIDLLNLLYLIGESLEHGDIKDIALELGVSRQTVSRTLNGESRSSRVLLALYQRARKNREQFMLYSQPAVMSAHLLNGTPLPANNHLPAVHVSGRSGLVGNQNARKHWNKKQRGGAL